MKRNIIFLSVLFIMITSLLNSASAIDRDKSDLAIVFTHDLHSHVEQYDLNGENVGGFSRIKTIIEKVKEENENTVVVDAGDFSMGTLYHTMYTTEAIEYKILSQMGYDAIALGNHEFDFSFDGIKSMISAAKESTSSLSPIICSNINSSESGLSSTELEKIGIHKYVILNKNQYSVAVFSLIGNDAADVTFDKSIVFDEYIESAEQIVRDIKERHDPDFIICLSHSGTGDDVNDEDIKLAKKVSDIDVIISAHTHTTLNEPIVVNDTIIVSCGEYGSNVGKLCISAERSDRSFSYELVKVNEEILPNLEIEESIGAYKNRVSSYLSTYGFESSNQIISHSEFDFPEQNTMSSSVKEQPLGNLISDSYIHAVKELEGENYKAVDVAVAPLGIIRNSITKGDITVNDAFEICSLGIGADGTAGYPLCSVYLYGSELWQIAEIDASVSTIMSYAQLYISGLGYSANTNRMFLNRVYDCWLIDENGNRVEIENDKLYRVVSGISSAEMLGTVKGKSFGILEITPKDSQGNPINDFDSCILIDNNGKEIKEWVSFAKYLSSFENKNGISNIPQKYATAQGRKNIYNSFDMSVIFKKWNKVSWIVAAICSICAVAIIYFVIRIIKRKKQKIKS